MKNILNISLFIIFLVPVVAHAEALAPWDFMAAGNTVEIPEPDMSPGAKFLAGALKFYRGTISRVDGERCRMHPSCSAYSLEAIRTHGAVVGFVMTADRLLHESNEMDYAPVIMLRNGKERYYDPVGANDFWWRINK